MNEYIIVKKILLNNSINMSITKLYPNNVKKVIKELRFNKRILQYNLLDMLRFRKLLLLKRRVYLFTILYEGENSKVDRSGMQRKKKVERMIADTFNFLNTKRVLMAIGYKPKEKVVSHDDNFKIEDGSDTDFDDPIEQFKNIDRRSFRKGGILSKNTSKISIHHVSTEKLSPAKTKPRSNTIGTYGNDIADHFRVGALSTSIEVERELDKLRDDDSINPIPNLGDSENSDED